MSKRTWSLPRPVQPWTKPVAPSFSAISTIFLAMRGRLRAGADGVFAFVEGVGFDGWENVFFGEFCFGVDAVVFEDAEFFGFFLCGFKVFALTNVYCYSDYLGVTFLLEVLD